MPSSPLNEKQCALLVLPAAVRPPASASVPGVAAARLCPCLAFGKQLLMNEWG